ncbi:5-carboxymethyl-2-hydroxymuconate Delta-isomerase [Algoriphagus sp. CAU 1675]|uniref:5-carboxymethyl-2-hydroxymuconate Delta-isomerase n=1 Tax=Algoriphagus sp. CAU 1675 TaxID=3032597 RepID=UPI0023DC4DE4|nr:5-carboxymethyl-2-hydroxymuconate Delta-isomerase [Algoriphagus sp. CAU 1675]MDF2157115.1 5-carboxymethyl-2-hydroxymuconate Delta-isomerase [Algoriphagus sp. CAU 1675]
MPHFIIDCSKVLLEKQPPEKIMKTVYEAVSSSGLFQPEDIKVRISPFAYSFGTFTPSEFIHVFGNIMEGRTADQKNALSERVVTELNRLFPELTILSINIRDFEKQGYFNKSMISGSPLETNYKA